MAMGKGFIKIYRRFFEKEDSFWKIERKFSYAEAWIDLLVMAHFQKKPKKKRIGNRFVTVEFGELVITLGYCADRWGWKKTKVWTWIKSLQKLDKIETKLEKNCTKITILNYTKYNGPWDEKANKNETEMSRKCNDFMNALLSTRELENKENPPPIPPLVPPHPPSRSTKSVLQAYAYPDWLDRDLWKQFCQMRSRIKKPIMTELTIARLLKALKRLMGQGHEQAEVIQSAIDGCWQSFYPPKKPDDMSKYV